MRVGAGQMDAASALGPHDTPKQRPTGRRWIELGGRFSAAERNLHLTSLQIGSVESGIAFPEECCLSSVVTRSKWFLILPNTSHREMILKVLPDTWQVLDNR